MKNNIPIPGILLLAIGLFVMVHANGQNAEEKSPRLIIQITIDQLRGDMPASVYDRFGKRWVQVSL